MSQKKNFQKVAASRYVHLCGYDLHLNNFFDLLTTQTHTIRRGALRFATQISPLLN